MRQVSTPWLALLGTAVLIACARPEAPPAPLACADLSTWTAESTRIDSAETVEATDDVPAFCKVTGTIDSEIHFEVDLPSHADWTGRFVMGGGGGFVGSVQNTAMGPLPGGNAIQRGFATVGTDTGHQGSGIDGSWALDNEQREVDFAYRAVHQVTQIAEEMIEDYYARPIDHSYFIGCSRGGGQAMIEAQRYPTDYDGIVAMAPAMSWPRFAAGFLQNQQKIYPDSSRLDEPVIAAENRALLEREILAQCDDDDGVEDGLLSDPRRCDFQPSSLLCSGKPNADCLTRQQLDAVETIYRGPVIDGQEVFPGFPFGGENDRGGWDAWITGGMAPAPDTPNLHYAFGTQMYKYLIYDDPDFDYATYDFADWSNDVAAADSLFSSTDTDLSAFRDGGGKLVLWHGWSDPALTALGTIEYYADVEAGDPEVRDYARLFLAPGVLHCGGGPGPDRVDLLSAVVDWVETGSAPDQLIASKVDASGETVRARPLCAYPEVAVYDGSGDPDDAASFRCQDKARLR